MDDISRKDLNMFQKARNNKVIGELMKDKNLAQVFNKEDERQQLLDTIKEVSRGRKITKSVMGEVAGEMLKEARMGKGNPANSPEALALERKYGIRFGREMTGTKNNLAKPVAPSMANMPKGIGGSAPAGNKNVSSANPASSPMRSLGLKF